MLKVAVRRNLARICSVLAAMAESNKDKDESEKEEEKESERFQKLAADLRGALGLSQAETAEEKRKLSELTLQGVAKLITDGNAKNIVVMTGAGVSTCTRKYPLIIHIYCLPETKHHQMSWFSSSY